LITKRFPLLLQEFFAATDNTATAVGPHHFNAQLGARAAVSRRWTATCLKIAKLFILVIARFSTFVALFLQGLPFGTDGFT
jgi:hypothetical protein